MTTDPKVEDGQRRLQDEQSAFLLIPWEPPEGYIFDTPPFTCAPASKTSTGQEKSS